MTDNRDDNGDLMALTPLTRRFSELVQRHLAEDAAYAKALSREALSESFTTTAAAVHDELARRGIAADAPVLITIDRTDGATPRVHVSVFSRN